MAKFRMKSPPTRPVRLTKYESVPISSGDSLESIIEIVGRQCPDQKFSDLVLELSTEDSSDYDGDGRAVACLEFQFPESDKDYEVRLKAYKKELDAYKAWQEENKEELAARAELERQQEIIRAANLKKSQEKSKLAQIKQLEKTLAKLKGDK